jgi:drug/metabolite transporter (DMT)-like permease
MSYQLWAVVALLGYTVHQLVLKRLEHLPPQVTLGLILILVATAVWGSILTGETKVLLGKIQPGDWKWILLGGLVLLIADYSFTKTYTLPGAQPAVITIIVSALLCHRFASFPLR